MEWLQKDLAQTNKKWKIAFFHRSPYNNKINRNEDAVRAAFVPVLDKYHVQVVFTAHDHVYARSGKHGVWHVATGRTGTKTYKTVEAKPWNSVFINPVERPMYMSVTMSGNMLIVGAFDQTGELLDSWELHKTK